MEAFFAAIRGHRRALDAVEALLPKLDELANLVESGVRAGAPIMFCGNGGSATDADHLAGEFVGRFTRERKPFAALSLSTSPAAVTAISNDYGYEQVFARQVEAFARPGSVLLAFSTSGNSPSILRAVERARDLNVVTAGFTAEGGGKLAEICELHLPVGTSITARAQEMHMLLGHILCDEVERRLAETP